MTKLTLGLTAAVTMACAWSGSPSVAAAGDIHALVNDQGNHPVEDAVVVAVPEGQSVAAPARAGREWSIRSTRNSFRT